MSLYDLKEQSAAADARTVRLMAATLVGVVPDYKRRNLSLVDIWFNDRFVVVVSYTWRNPHYLVSLIQRKRRDVLIEQEYHNLQSATARALRMLKS